MPTDTFLAKDHRSRDSQRTKSPATRSRGHNRRSATAAKSKSKQRFARRYAPVARLDIRRRGTTYREWRDGGFDG